MVRMDPQLSVTLRPVSDCGPSGCLNDVAGALARQLTWFCIREDAVVWEHYCQEWGKLHGSCLMPRRQSKPEMTLLGDLKPMFGLTWCESH
jgi:hypothetical protein